MNPRYVFVCDEETSDPAVQRIDLLGPVLVPAQSPLAYGNVYGLRVAASGSSRWGEGAETGNGVWVAATTAPDSDGNIGLRAAAQTLKLTGYYRPEDMDIGPVAESMGTFRVCWANTGRKSHTADSIVESSAAQSEIVCLVGPRPLPHEICTVVSVTRDQPLHRLSILTPMNEILR